MALIRPPALADQRLLAVFGSDPEHAAVLFNLVRKEGLSNTLIVIRQ